MKVGLHDADKTRFPNLALMKLAAWHKAQGDVDPFAQPYREPGSKHEPAKILKHFARWVNRKWIFKTVSWADYLGKVA